MKRAKFTFLFLACTMFSIAQSPVGWQQSYGGSSTDIGASIWPTMDSGFVVAGTVKSIDGDVTDKHATDTLTTDIWVVKTNSSGDLEWTRSYGGSNDDYARAIQQTPDKGYLIASNTYSSDGDNLGAGHHGIVDISLIKTDSLGGILWSRCYGGSGYETVDNFIQTTDGGYLVLGRTYNSGTSGDLAGIGSNGWTDWFVLKLDGSGNIIWKRGYGGNLDDHAQDALMTADGGYIIVGETESYAGSGDVTANIGNNHTYDVWVLKVNSTGAIQWRSNFGGTQHEWGVDIKPTSDGNYMIAGWTSSTDYDATGNHGGRDGFLLKMDPAGSKIWSKVIGGSADEIFSRLLPVETSNFLVTGYTRSNDGDVSGNHGSHDGWLVEIDGDGNIQWQNCVGSTAADELMDLNHLQNQSVVVAGYAGASNGDVIVNYGSSDVWTFILDATDATLSDLTVNGTTVAGFTPDIFEYDVILPAGTSIVPAVTATTTSATASHVINNAGSLPGSASVIVTSTDGSASLTYTVNYLIEPDPPVSAHQTSCFGLPVPDLSATGSNIRWYSDALLTSQVHSGNTFATGMTDPGTYTYYVTQTVDNVQSAASEVTLTIYALPVVIASASDGTLCASEELTLTGSGALGYTWDHGVTDGVSFVPPSGTTTYTVTGTDVNGCFNTDAVTINVNEVPFIEVEDLDSVFCNYSDMELTITNRNSVVFGDWKYSLAVDYGAQVTGLNIGGEYDASDLILMDHPENHSNDAQRIEYRFTPRITPSGGGADCEGGLEILIYRWIFPSPGIEVAASDTILCNGETTELMVTNPNVNIAGTWMYDLVVTSDVEITGAISSQTGINTASISQTLHNHDTIVHKVEYQFVPRIIPDDLGAECAGGMDTTIVIWVNPTPENRVSVSDTVLCNGDAVSLQLRNPNTTIRGLWEGTLEIIPEAGITGVVTGTQVFTGDALYSYVLHNAANEQQSVTFVFTPLIRDDNADLCTNGKDTTIIVWVNPTAHVNTPPDLMTIHGETTTEIVFTSNTQGGSVSYFWSNDTPSIGLASSGIGDIAPFTALNTGTLPVIATVRVSPAYSGFEKTCTGPDVQFLITVNPSAPAANAGEDQVLCGTLTTALEGNDPEYGTGMWTTVSGPGIVLFDDANTHNTSATASIYGIYVLRWTITSGNNVTSDELTIIFHEEPVQGSAGADQGVCGILNSILQAVPHTYQPGSDYSGSTMQWSYVSGPDSNPVFNDITSPTSMVTVVQMGTYVLRWTETNGTCSSEDEVTVSFFDLPVASAGPDQEVCFGEPVTLMASGGTQYAWDNGVVNGVPFIPNTTKEYQVTVVDENGCASQDQALVVVYPIPQTPTITFSSDTLFSDSETGNQWYVDGILIADETVSFHVPTSTGTYYTIITQDDCSSEKSNNIFVQITSIEQADILEFKIYPNPVKDIITIETEGYDAYRLEISASTGQLMLEELVADPVHTVNLTQFSNGIYFITIRTEEQVRTERFIKY